MTYYNSSSSWVSRLVATRAIPAFDSPLLNSLCRFGLPSVLLPVCLGLRLGGEASWAFLLELTLCTAWTGIGPFFIWFYDEKVLPEFAERATEIVQNPRELNSLAARYDRFFARSFWYTMLPWTALLVVVFISTRTYFEGQGLSPGDWLYWYLAIYWLVTSIISGVGFIGVVTTLRFIRDITKLDLKIDPLHPDRLGGLSVFGYYAIRTTLTFSSGALAIPLGLQIASGVGADSLIYVLIAIYALFIALSFVVPTLGVHRAAKNRREGELDQLRQEYSKIKEKLVQEDMGHEERVVGALRLQVLRNEYMDFRRLQLYPMEIDVFTKLVLSVLFPLLMVAIEALIQHYVELFLKL